MPEKRTLGLGSRRCGFQSLLAPISWQVTSSLGLSFLLNKWVKTVCPTSFWVMVEGPWQGLDFGAKQTWLLKQSLDLSECLSSFVK